MSAKENEHIVCPTAEELAALFDGALPEKKCRPLREHLVRCQKCCEDVRYLSSILPWAAKKRKPARPQKTVFARLAGQSNSAQTAKKNASRSAARPRDTTGDR